MLRLDESYSDYVDKTDPNFPLGKAVDASTVDSVDGTPWLASFMNDLFGSRTALFKEAFGQVSAVSGKPDNVENSDFVKAIKKIINFAVDKEIKARKSGDTSTLSSAKDYTNNKIKEFVTKMFIKYFCNKIYIQRWGDPSPSSIWVFKGYRWKEIDRRGVFDRPRGSGARFTAKINGTNQTLKGGGSTKFDGAIHGDKIRNITGAIEGGFYGESNKLKPTGVFAKTKGKSKVIYSNWTETLGFLIDASRVVPTGVENTPIYQTAIYWKLEKI